MKESRICSKCEIEKPLKEFDAAFYKDRESRVTPRCKECRKDTYYQQRYGTECIQCLKPRKIDSNKICPTCNELSGIRECASCKQLLIVFLKFKGSKRQCFDCLTLPSDPV